MALASFGNLLEMQILVLPDLANQIRHLQYLGQTYTKKIVYLSEIEI